MEEIGYGFGKREYERLNCVRAILGETQDKVEEENSGTVLYLDDMTSEEIGYATDLLLKRRRIGCLHILHSDEEKPAGDSAHMYVQGRTERVFPTADIQTHLNTWGQRVFL